MDVDREKAAPFFTDNTTRMSRHLTVYKFARLIILKRKTK